MSEFHPSADRGPYRDLQELFTRHLRSRAMLKEVIRAEHEILSEIVSALKNVPQGRRAAVVGRCVDGAAAALVCDSKFL